MYVSWLEMGQKWHFFWLKNEQKQKNWSVLAKNKNSKNATYPDWHISPCADCRHREIQIVYNTGRHRPCGGQFFTPHTVRGCPASLLHRANNRRTYVINFSIFGLGAYPWAKVHKKGRWPTIHLDLPSYKISAQSRKRSTWYVLLKFFPLFGLWG